MYTTVQHRVLDCPINNHLSNYCSRFSVVAAKLFIHIKKTGPGPLLPYGHLLLAPAEGWWPLATWKALRALWIAIKKQKQKQNNWTPIFSIVAPPIPPTTTPPTPCTEFFFYPHFFIGPPPPIHPPPPPPPYPLHRVIFYFLFIFCGHLGFY